MVKPKKELKTYVRQCATLNFNFQAQITTNQKQWEKYSVRISVRSLQQIEISSESLGCQPRSQALSLEISLFPVSLPIYQVKSPENEVALCKLQGRGCLVLAGGHPTSLAF